MKTSRVLLAGVLSVLFVSCEYPVVPGETTTPGYPTAPGYPSQPYPEGAMQYMRMGHDRGSIDAKKGLSANPARHWSTVPRVNRENFSQGYNDGYRGTNGIQGNEGAEFFQRGRSVAATDHRKGLRYDPSRHFTSIPTRYRAEFTRGYAVGW